MSFIRSSILPPIIAAIYWIWSRTWRLKIIEDPEFSEALKKGSVIFSHWHGDELVVLRLGSKYHCAAMTSTSADGELMTKVLKIFGFGISRGSSTRGGARALLGMVHLIKSGYNATVAVDGPKGPRHKVKSGVWALAKHSGCPIIPTGVAAPSSYIFKKSWNKTFLPWPFTKIVVKFGAPVNFTPEESEYDLNTKLEQRLFKERGHAQAKILSFLIFFIFLISGCAQTPSNPYEGSQQNSELSLLDKSAHIPLKAIGKILPPHETPQIKYVYPGSVAQKLGFKSGDLIIKMNGLPIESSIEFEKKIKILPSPIEFEFKSGKSIFIKHVSLLTSRPRFGATTLEQNTPIIKPSSPAILRITKGLLTVYCSASVSKDHRNLYLNFILDSDTPKKPSPAIISVFRKSDKKLLGSAQEQFDASSEESLLISKNFPFPSSPIGGLIARIVLDKQQFNFEFQD